MEKKIKKFKGSKWEKRVKQNPEFYNWVKAEVNKYLSNIPTIQSGK